MIVIIFAVLGLVTGILILIGSFMEGGVDEKVFGAIFGLGLIAISIIGLLPDKAEPKKMTINYEFRDSVYIPIDTVITNN